MRNIIYHYTAVIQPFIFISSMFGAKKALDFFTKRKIKGVYLIISIIIFSTLIFSYFKGPLPYSKEKEVHPFLYPEKEAKEVTLWSKTLRDESLKISATGHLAPFFTSRRYYYFFSNSYSLADYIVIRRVEIYNYPEKNELIPVYENLLGDERYKQIYKNGDLEVFKKLVVN
jgi:uncharacterized membrane protein